MAGVGELWRARAQYGVETVYGTPVAATRIAYLMNQPTLSRTRPPRTHSYANNSRANALAATLGPAEVAGSITMPLSADEILEWLLTTMKGAVTPTTPTGATGGRLWTFVPGNTALDSMTLEFDDGVTAWRGYGLYGDQMTLNWNANGEATSAFTLMGIERKTNALTGALTERTPTLIEGWESIVFIDAFGGTPGKTQIPNFCISGTLTFNNNLQRKYFSNNRNATARIVTQPYTATASLVVEAFSPQAAIELANWDTTPPTYRLVSVRLGGNDPISGETPVNEVQTGTISGGPPASGTVILNVLGQATAAIAYNAIASAVQSAINTALAALGTDYTVTCAGGPWPGTPITVTFTGTEVAGKDVPLITVTTSTLNTGTLAFVETTPGYSGKRAIWLDIPGYWSAVDIGQTDNGTRAYRMDMSYLYDPTNAFGVRARVQNGRASAW